MSKAEELRKQTTKILWRGMDAYDAANVEHLITQYAEQESRERAIKFAEYVKYADMRYFDYNELYDEFKEQEENP